MNAGKRRRSTAERLCRDVKRAFRMIVTSFVALIAILFALHYIRAPQAFEAGLQSAALPAWLAVAVGSVAITDLLVFGALSMNILTLAAWFFPFVIGIIGPPAFISVAKGEPTSVWISCAIFCLVFTSLMISGASQVERSMDLLLPYQRSLSTEELAMDPGFRSQRPDLRQRLEGLRLQAERLRRQYPRYSTVLALVIGPGSIDKRVRNSHTWQILHASATRAMAITLCLSSLACLALPYVFQISVSNAGSLLALITIFLAILSELCYMAGLFHNRAEVVIFISVIIWTAIIVAVPNVAHPTYQFIDGLGTGLFLLCLSQFVRRPQRPYSSLNDLTEAFTASSPSYGRIPRRPRGRSSTAGHPTSAAHQDPSAEVVPGNVRNAE